MYKQKLTAFILVCILFLSFSGTLAETAEQPDTANPTESITPLPANTPEPKKVQDIIERNEDVLDAVFASCRYGIHRGGQKNYIKRLSMLVTTDVHGVWGRLEAAVKYLNAIPSLDCGCCLGDMINGDSFYEESERYDAAVAASEKMWFTIIGNHDCGNSVNPEICGTTEQVVGKYIEPNENKAGQNGLKTPYYYYDWDAYYIRFIVLYNYESPLDKDKEGNYIIRRGDECYDQEQLDWFISTLNNTPEHYAVVVLQHSQPEANLRVDCNFSQPHIIQRGNGSGCYGRASIKGDIVDAWIKGTTLTKDYEPEEKYAGVLPTIKVSADFTSRGPGEFICYLVGHEHVDVVTRLQEHPEQITICLAATTNDAWNNAASDLPRIGGDKSEDAITVISFDNISKRINLVRIGSRITYNMTDRTMLSIPYIQN